MGLARFILFTVKRNLPKGGQGKMVKVIFGEHSHQANLAGRSVAEVRDMYRFGFGMPDRANASLNGKRLRRELEPETKVGDHDKLVFEAKSRKGLVLLGSFLLTLIVTGSLFAYTYTTRSATITVNAATADFASISTNATPATIDLKGKVRGAIGDATMFDITGDGNYTGDVEVLVSLANADELSSDYSFWMMRLQLVDASNATADLEGITKIITLDNPTTSFAVDSANISGVTVYVRTPGGSYRTYPFVLGSSGNDPLIFCEVIQADAQ
jgi:hypothetical protein